MPPKDQSGPGATRSASPGRRLGAAFAAPLAAASPLLVFGYAAYLAGSASYTLYVEAFFGLLTLAWPVAVIAGVPLSLVLEQLDRDTPLWCALSGAGLALLARTVLDGGWPQPADAPAWTASQWLALLVYGALAGWLFGRRARRTPGAR
jgi:hypothetical protein